jgi:hypothetical protein
MGLRHFTAQLAIQGGIADFELSQEVSPLVLQLSRSAGNPVRSADGADLTAIESVAAGLSLFMYGSQIGVDRGSGRPLGLEASQLGVMTIALGLIPEYGLGQKCLTPKCDEAL